MSTLSERLRDMALYLDIPDFKQRADLGADELDRLTARVAELESALCEVREEWAGAECGEPVYAQEAYAIGLAKRMYSIAVAALESKHE